jgi:DNA polymerase-1
MYKKPILNPERETLVIVDANAYVHSSFHGYPERLDAKGQDQRILHGLMDTLVSLTYQLSRIDSLFLIFDPDDGSLFRESQFPAYKKNRPPTDPDLSRQRNAAKLIFKEQLGIPMVHYAGYEADDIIGSLAKTADKKYQVVIVSPDKDIAQCVDDNIFMLRRWRTKTERGYTLMDKHIVLEEFGVSPNQIPDWLALMGDDADNLPGLYKVGKKNAATYVHKYMSVEHLLSIAHQLDDEKLKEKVLNAKDTLPLIKSLATIVCDLPVKELAEQAIIYGNNIRNKPNYKEHVLKLEKYFRWQPHYKEIFL